MIRSSVSAASPWANRFWSHVDRNGDCWLWLAGLNSYGYGKFKQAGRTLGAHRVSYELNVGPIPDGQSVLHRCDTPACVNPSHLFLGSHVDNMRDMAAKGRRDDRRGAKHPLVKLSEDQAIAIRSDPRIGRLVAAEFGIAESMVSRIRAGIRWGHLS
jgi:hypothetical protein